MEPLVVHHGTAMPLRRSGVDTDQIVPAEFCKRVTRTGYADALFAGWRADPASVLNDPRYAGASILLAGPDFGVGSSREHAAWALRDGGYRVIVAPGFGDIFARNALQNGLLPVVLPAPVVDHLMAGVEAEPGLTLVVDVLGGQVRAPGVRARIDLDPRRRWMLLNGLDDVDLTLRRVDRIAAYERDRAPWLPSTGRRAGG